MLSTVAVIGAFTGLGLLLVSGIAHVRGLTAFRRALGRQAVFPDRLAWPVASAVTAAEVLVGAAGTVALGVEVFAPGGTLASGDVRAPGTGWAAGIAYPTTTAATVMYTCFTVYSAYLVRRRPEAPCGCSMADHPAGWTVVGRAAVLAVACGAVAFVPQGITTVPLGSAAGALFGLAAAVFIVLAWSLPTALRNPSE